jgi:Putative prokaryotic signal transducing protein
VTKEQTSAVHVAHVTYSWPEAEVVCSMLNAAGIPAFLPDRNTVGNLGFQSFALGGFRIIVAEQDAKDAKAIVDEFRAAEPTEKLPESAAFWRQPIRNALWLVVNYFFGWCPAWLRKRQS